MALNQGVFPLGGQLATLETFLIVTSWRRWVLGSIGQRPGTLLNTLLCTGQPPKQGITRRQGRLTSLGLQEKKSSPLTPTTLGNRGQQSRRSYTCIFQKRSRSWSQVLWSDQIALPNTGSFSFFNVYWCLICAEQFSAIHTLPYFMDFLLQPES